jgi:SAM-dependent methyltransferase
MTFTFSGSGPGTQSPDGCSVELYRALPYLGELEDVTALLRAGDSILELGCGTGRLCAHLEHLGLRVTGVDESADMLAALPPTATAVRSTIESLVLNRRFDTVLLASHLINHPDPHSRRAFIECARRHLNPGGRFLLKRHSPEWLQTVKPGVVRPAGPLMVHAEHVSRRVEAIDIRLRYEGFGQVWHQSFSTVALSEPQIERLLEQAGFAEMRWHGDLRLWASAVAQ